MFGLVQLSMIRFSLGLSSITGVVGRFYYVPGRTAAVCEIKVGGGVLYTSQEICYLAGVLSSESRDF